MELEKGFLNQNEAQDSVESFFSPWAVERVRRSNANECPFDTFTAQYANTPIESAAADAPCASAPTSDAMKKLCDDPEAQISDLSSKLDGAFTAIFAIRSSHAAGHPHLATLQRNVAALEASSAAAAAVTSA